MVYYHNPTIFPIYLSALIIQKYSMAYTKCRVSKQTSIYVLNDAWMLVHVDKPYGLHPPVKPL